MSFAKQSARALKIPDNDNLKPEKDRTSVDKLIYAYLAEKKRLDLAIKSEKNEEVEVIDRNIVGLFNSVLKAQPMDAAEENLLIEFLLDLLCPNQGESNLNSKIKSKIKQLATK